MKSPDYDDSVGRKRLEHMARGDQLKAVIFDLDGTLIHSNVPFPPYRDRLNIQGDVIAGIGKLPPELQKEKWDIIAEYESELERQAQPAPGVRPLLVYLIKKGIYTGVITRSRGEYAQRLISAHDLQVDISLGREDIKPKPHPDGLEYLLEQFGGIRPENAIMVGDFLWDILAGRNAGMLTVLILLPHSNEFADKADVVVRSLHELHDLIKTEI